MGSSSSDTGKRYHKPLRDSLADAVDRGEDYLSTLRKTLVRLQIEFDATVIGLQLYGGQDPEPLFTLVLPEYRHAADVQDVFAVVRARRRPVINHVEVEGNGRGVQRSCPVIAAPLMQGDRLVATVALVRLRAENFTNEQLVQLNNALPILRTTIEEAVMQRTLIAGYLKTIEALALALEAKDPYTRGHSNMVCSYSLAIAQKIGLTREEQDSIALGAIMHDIGKIGVSDQVLNKVGPLTPAEWEEMKRHPAIGEQILKPLNHPYLDRPRRIVRHHHERLDGRGYPDGLVAGDIPVDVRIVTVADAWDAMTSDRPYRPALDYPTAGREMVRHAGTMWDPEIVAVHLSIVYPPALQDLMELQSTVPSLGSVA